MITFLQATNRVLVKLRESEISSFSGVGDYPLLIATLVNEAKEEVEAAWDWNYQRTSVVVTTVAGTSTYPLTGAGSEPSIEAVVNTTSNGPVLGPTSNSYADQIRSDNYSYFDVVGIDTNGDIQVRLSPVPTADVL